MQLWIYVEIIFSIWVKSVLGYVYWKVNKEYFKF